MSFALVIESLPHLASGVLVTLQLVLLALLAGFALALPTALLRRSRNPLGRAATFAYVFFFRGTPLLVQIFLIYYGLAQFEAVRTSPLWSVLRDPYWCALIALALNTGAYTAEILRGGMEAVPAGQLEAGRAAGMGPVTLFRRILWPQAMRHALPGYGNEVILLVKASSLASTVTLLDITGAARTLAADTYRPLEIFAIAGMVYLGLTFCVTRIVHALERRLTRHERLTGHP